MNLPFPSINPRLVYYRWFSNDSNLADDEFELAAIELENQIRFNRISMRYTQQMIIGQPDPDSVDGDTAATEDGVGEHFEVEETSPSFEYVPDNEVVEEEENSDDYEDVEEEEVLSRSLDDLDILIDHESSEATSHWSSLR
ncbi:hypothetical protein K1T71_000320 [Dendrolimus kikuchii]|uniref:Uncharacterized protein n=1 Tax=Dendrolimus kikuchii TaxID=765133 RepID=A0ACC1DJV7_9NEOP|nr:hypothetical protein K1T71_000320 [Dendrolimus kikuchii]